MNTYYSILFCPIRPAINEQVSIALLLVEDENILFRYSSEKLSFLRKLIPPDAVNLLKQYVEGIYKDIYSIQENSKREKGGSILFKEKVSEYSSYSEKYLNYLNSFNNNLVSFSKPKRIDVDVNDKNFKFLYEKFISDDYILELNKEFLSEIEKAQQNIYPKIEKRVHLDIDIHNIKIPEIKSPRILLPEKINIFGRNGKYFSGQFFDFDKKVNYLKADLSFYFNFIHEINDEGTNYIIGNEPDNIAQKNHNYWSDIKNYSKIKYLHLDEIEKIVEFIENNNVNKIPDLL